MRLKPLIDGRDWTNLFDEVVVASRDASKGNESLVAIVNEKLTLPPHSPFGKYWASLKNVEDYAATAALLVNGQYSGREDFVRCGYDSFRCGDRFCLRCCFWKQALKLKTEFGTAISPGMQTWYVVASLSSAPDETQRLIFNDATDHTSSETSHRLRVEPQEYGLEFDGIDAMREERTVWKIFAEAVAELTGTDNGKIFLGSLGGPELALKFLPLRVIPHSNFIVWTPALSIDGARKLRKLIRKKFRNCRGLRGGIYPSLFFERITSTEHLSNVIKYISKPINLKKPYEFARHLAGGDSAKLSYLNGEVKSFLNDVLILFYGLRKIRKNGICSPNHRFYIGERRKQPYTDWRVGQKPNLSQVSSQQRWERYALFSKVALRPFKHPKFFYWQLWTGL